MAENEPKTGYEELLASLLALPGRYSRIRDAHVQKAEKAKSRGLRGFGPWAERVVEDILVSEGLTPKRPGPLYQVEIRGIARGRINPDFLVGGEDYIEVTKWGDSNKLASILANGLLVKAKQRNARYFAIVASYKAESGWTDDEEVEFFLGEAARMLRRSSVDAFFGFANIDCLVDTLRE